MISITPNIIKRHSSLTLFNVLSNRKVKLR
nr:MAG TPA: hypothetical protein [Caudoviricetes sp.]